MTPKVKKFIETYIEAIEDNSLEFVFRQAASELSSDEIFVLSQMLEDIGISTDKSRWSVFDKLVIEFIQAQLAKPLYARGRSNSWARVDYMLEEISDLGLGWSAVKKHVIHNSDMYGTTVYKLSPKYGWEGEGDYAFDWFDMDEFDKEFGNE